MKVESIINIYNKLTETKDLETFKKILDYHYDKFRYFYRALEKCSEKDNIFNISCNEVSENLLEIIIEVEKKTKIDDTCDNLLDSFKPTYFDKYSITTSINKKKKIIQFNLTNPEEF